MSVGCAVRLVSLPPWLRRRAFSRSDAARVPRVGAQAQTRASNARHNHFVRHGSAGGTQRPRRPSASSAQKKPRRQSPARPACSARTTGTFLGKESRRSTSRTESCTSRKKGRQRHRIPCPVLSAFPHGPVPRGFASFFRSCGAAAPIKTGLCLPFRAAALCNAGVKNAGSRKRLDWICSGASRTSSRRSLIGGSRIGGIPALFSSWRGVRVPVCRGTTTD